MPTPSCDSNPKRSRGAAEPPETCAPTQPTRSRNAKSQRHRAAAAALGALSLTSGIAAALDTTANSSEVHAGQLSITLTAHDGFKLGTGDGDDQGFDSPYTPSPDDRYNNYTDYDNSNNIPNEMQVFAIRSEPEFPVGTYNGEVTPANIDNNMVGSTVGETYTNPFNDNNNNNNNNNNAYEMDNMRFQVPAGFTTDPPNSPQAAWMLGTEGKDAYGNVVTMIYPINANEIDVNIPPMTSGNSYWYGDDRIDYPNYDSPNDDN